MAMLFFLISTLAFIGLIVGIIKPNLFKFETRKSVIKVFVPVMLVSFIIFVIALDPTAEETTAEIDPDEEDEETEVVDDEDDNNEENNDESDFTQEDAYIVFFESITTMYQSYLSEMGELLTDEASFYTTEWEDDLLYLLENMELDSEEVLERDNIPENYEEAHEYLVLASEEMNEVATDLYEAIENDDVERIEELTTNVENIGQYTVEAIVLYDEVN